MSGYDCLTSQLLLRHHWLKAIYVLYMLVKSNLWFKFIFAGSVSQEKST